MPTVNNDFIEEAKVILNLSGLTLEEKLNIIIYINELEKIRYNIIKLKRGDNKVALKVIIYNAKEIYSEDYKRKL